MECLRVMHQHSLRGTVENNGDSVSLRGVQNMYLLVVTGAPSHMEGNFGTVRESF
jgi:hypothetical protein